MTTAPTTELRSLGTTSPLRLRLALTRRAAIIIVTAGLGTALLPVWITLAALSPLTVVAPLVIPATWLVRRYADVHRVSAATVLDEPIASPYRTANGGLLDRVLTILRDPASWRDALWLLVHPVVGITAAVVDLALLLAGVFYLIFPALWAVTPPAALRNQFGFVDIDTLPRAFACMPLALVAFGLWWGLTVPLARLVAGLDRALLRPLHH